MADEVEAVAAETPPETAEVTVNEDNEATSDQAASEAAE